MAKADINWPTGPTTGDQYTSPNGKTWIWNGYAWDAIALTNRDRYVIYDFSHGDLNPVDETVYYIGDLPDMMPTTTNDVSRRVISQVDGLVVNVSLLVFILGATAGFEESIFKIVNNTTSASEYISTTVIHNTSKMKEYELVTPLPVSKGDELYVQWETPIWVNEPSMVHHRLAIKILLT